MRVIAVFAEAIINQTALPRTEIALNVSDFFLSPALIIGGILLWKRKAFGYVTGAGLLFQTSMLFIGLIIFLLLQPVLTGAPFALVDTIVILIMGLVFFIPFGLFIRGIIQN